MKMVEHIINPNRLLLIWQAVDGAAGKGRGDRYIVGEVRKSQESLVLEYYDNEVTQKVAQDLGFNGLTAFPFHSDKIYTNHVKETLEKRLAPSSRLDYADYLRAYRLPIQMADKFSVMQLLAYTGGVLAGDGFSFVPTFENISLPFDFIFEIAGFRHHDGMNIGNISSLQGQTVLFNHDNQHKEDCNAIEVICNGTNLGYVPKGLNISFIKDLLGKTHLKAHITRINGTKERPSVWVMVSVSEQ
jgi:hypothetical protein